MKTFRFILIFTLCFCSIQLFSQNSLFGDWTATAPDGQGGTMTFKVSMKKDMTYTVDFAADGTIDIEGTMSIDGDQVTIQDKAGSDCTGKGVYKYTIEGKTLTMKQVSEECDGREGPEGIMQMTKL